MDADSIRSYAPLGRAISPKASKAQIVWYLSWLGAFLAFLLLDVVSPALDPILAVVSVLMIVFGAVSDDERPMFLSIPHKVYFAWRHYRVGVAVTRQFSSRDVTYRKGVTPLRGLFDINATNVSMQLTNGKPKDIPVFQSAGRHSVIVLGRNSGDTAIASPYERQLIDERRAAMFGRVTKTLGPGNGLAQWSITRPANPHPGDQYLSLRGDADKLDSSDEAVAANRDRAFASKKTITDQSWDRITGITVNAADPRSWKPHRLHKMNPAQVRESLAVKAALEIEASAGRAQIDRAHIVSPLEFAWVSREFWSLGAELNDVRRHYLRDKTTLLAAAKTPEAPPSEVWLNTIEPMPQMHREVCGNYIILDGTYHRIMWAVDSSLQRVEGGVYDELHQMPCSNIVSITGLIVSRKDDEKIRNRRNDARDYLNQRRRYESLEETEAVEAEEEGKRAVFYSGGNAVYFRLLFVASGQSYEEMVASEEVIRSTATDLDLELLTITGTDQLVWFWAAIGTIIK